MSSSSDESDSSEDHSPTKKSPNKPRNKSYPPFIGPVWKRETQPTVNKSAHTGNSKRGVIPRRSRWDISCKTSEDAPKTITTKNKEMESKIGANLIFTSTSFGNKAWEIGNSSRDSSFSTSTENISKIDVKESSFSNATPDAILKRGYFGNYQLLGDSQFVRFSKEILGLKNTITDDKRPQIGFCISGQTSTELAKLVLENYEYLDDNLIIMIGTNDVKNRVSPFTFIQAIRTLKLKLEWKNILWLTIPPIPKFSQSELHIQRLIRFNSEIKKLEGNNIKVIDAYNIFMDNNNKVMDYCYEKYYESKTLPYRTDEIHLNKSGHIKLCAWLCFHLLPQKLDVIKKYRERKGSTERSKLYNEYLYLEKLLPNSSGITKEDLYSYFMEPSKMRKFRRSYP